MDTRSSCRYPHYYGEERANAQDYDQEKFNKQSFHVVPFFLSLPSRADILLDFQDLLSRLFTCVNFFLCIVYLHQGSGTSVNLHILLTYLFACP
jgi:hypothetical protein